MMPLVSLFSVSEEFAVGVTALLVAVSVVQLLLHLVNMCFVALPFASVVLHS